jgi:hypothetical protein
MAKVIYMLIINSSYIVLSIVKQPPYTYCLKYYGYLINQS